MERIGVGVVGYGYAGRAFHSYLIALERDRGLELTAIATRAPERQAQARQAYPSAAIYPDIDALLRDDRVQLVVIATPHHTHHALTLRALQAGRHVVVDKIMAMNLRQGEEMIEAAQRRGLFLTVFHNRRWDWDYLTVRAVLQRGLLGAPYLFESAIFGYGPPRGWRASAAEGGGILSDWGAHLVDQALQLVPEPVRQVEATVQTRRWPSDAGSYVRLTLHFARDVLFVIEVGNLARRAKPRWFILGEEGALVRQSRDPQEPFLVRGHIDETTEPDTERALVTTGVGGLQAEYAVQTVRGSWRSFYRNVADVLLRGSQPAVGLQEMRRLLAVFDAATQAAQTALPVRPAGE